MMEWKPISLDVPLPQGTRVQFDNGAMYGTGFIYGIAAQTLPVLGLTYILLLEDGYCYLTEDTFYTEYNCVAMFACHIKTYHLFDDDDNNDEKKEEEDEYVSCHSEEEHMKDSTNIAICEKCGWKYCRLCEYYGCQCYTR